MKWFIVEIVAIGCFFSSVTSVYSQVVAGNCCQGSDCSALCQDVNGNPITNCTYSCNSIPANCGGWDTVNKKYLYGQCGSTTTEPGVDYCVNLGGSWLDNGKCDQYSSGCFKNQVCSISSAMNRVIACSDTGGAGTCKNPGTPPIIPPPNYHRGVHDSSTCTYSVGWACCTDSSCNRDDIAQIKLYDGLPERWGGNLIGSGDANKTRTDPNFVKDSGCNSRDHGFDINYTVPFTAGTHNIYAVYWNNYRRVLTGTPKTVVCAAPTPTAAWFQVKDGDVTTNGNLTSNVPTSNYFELPGLGGYPGIPAYGGSTNLTSLNVSQTTASTQPWIANSAYSSQKVYDSNYFLNAIPSGVTPTIITSSLIDQSTIDGAADSGYNWYVYDPGVNVNPPLSIGSTTNSNPINIGSKKIILIVKGADVNINQKITLDDGSGFFLLVAGDKNKSGSKGNINVDATNVAGGGVPNLEGIYVSDGEFDTKTQGANDKQLWVRGSVIAYGGIKLQRKGDTADPTAPAELFEFAPDLVLLFPGTLGIRPMSWQEVAP